MQVEVKCGTLRKLQNPERYSIRPAVYNLIPREGGSIYTLISTPLSPYRLIVQNTQDGQIVVCWGMLPDIVARNMHGERIQPLNGNFADLTEEATKTVLLTKDKWDRRYRAVGFKLIDEAGVEANLNSPPVTLSTVVTLPIPQ